MCMLHVMLGGALRSTVNREQVGQHEQRAGHPCNLTRPDSDKATHWRGSKIQECSPAIDFAVIKT